MTASYVKRAKAVGEPKIYPRIVVPGSARRHPRWWGDAVESL
ncbi:MAG: hypothetical protein ACLQF0_02025 [Dissulfurispiraceae bacterium]